MKKINLTPEKAAELLKSVHMMGSLNAALHIEYHNILVETKFKDPAINQHSKRITESISAVRNSLNSRNNVFMVKDSSHLEVEYGVEIHRLLSYFCEQGIDVIREFNDGIEKIKER